MPGHWCFLLFSSSDRPSGLHCGRFDVLVEMEEVGRIILVLQSHQPFVVDPIRISYRCQPFLFTSQEVDIGSIGCKRLHRRPERTGPANIGVCFAGLALIPGSQNVKGVVLLTQRKGGLGWIDAAYCTMDML